MEEFVPVTLVRLGLYIRIIDNSLLAIALFSLATTPMLRWPFRLVDRLLAFVGIYFLMVNGILTLDITGVSPTSLRTAVLTPFSLAIGYYSVRVIADLWPHIGESLKGLGNDKVEDTP